MTRWFVADRGRRFGPFDENVLADKLAAGEISQAALVWKEGLSEWQPVTIHFPPSPPVIEEPVAIESPTPSQARRKSRLARYWRGDFPLAISFWIVGLIGFVLVLFLLTIYTVNVERQGFHPYLVLSLVAPVWFITGAFAIFHFIGTWRSASRYLEENRGRVVAGTLTWLAQTAAVGGIVLYATLFWTSGAAQLREGWEIAFLNDPSIPDYSIRLMRGDTEGSKLQEVSSLV
jgi:hypothetical protein